LGIAKAGYLYAICPSCRPTNSVRALKVKQSSYSCVI